MEDNRASIPLTGTNIEAGASQNPSPDGSIRSDIRKASDFAWDANRVCREIDSYPKTRRYVVLKLQDMYISLHELYTKAFEAQWQYFKRVADTVNPIGTEQSQAPSLMAKMYISHWILDLYTCNRIAIQKLTPVAFTEYYQEKVPLNSMEYDAFLVHLNSCIRPTQVKGSTEDQMYLPRFAETIDWTQTKAGGYNIFGLEGFNYSPYKFKALITAIKDKRASWKTATLTTEAVGRPFWLFDWHATQEVCSWFPTRDNYDLEDVSYAYILGVACTPLLAPQDSDSWQTHPEPAAANFRQETLQRVVPRRFFGDYEVHTYHCQRISIDTSFESGNTPGTTSAHQKRMRPAREEGDPSQPRRVVIEEHGDLTMNFHLIRKTTFIYHDRVISEISQEDRFSALLALILDDVANAMY